MGNPAQKGVVIQGDPSLRDPGTFTSSENHPCKILMKPEGKQIRIE